MSYTTTRSIGIDAGHRLSTHGAKCRHLHGHRYTIEASATAATLHAEGEQSGMALDFGFLKDAMMEAIDAPCDHGLILCLEDRAALELFLPEGETMAGWHAELARAVAEAGFAAPDRTRLGQKLYVVAGQPTAEFLARHWFSRLAPSVAARSDGLAVLTAVRVWETPNCWAEYAPR